MHTIAQRCLIATFAGTNTDAPMPRVLMRSPAPSCLDKTCGYSPGRSAVRGEDPCHLAMALAPKDIITVRLGSPR